MTLAPASSSIRVPRRAGKMRGAAAVELGILLVPVLILTFGVTEYGRAIYTYNALDKSTRDAARHMTSPNPNRQAEAVNLAVYGNTAGSGYALAPGLSPSNVVICDPTACPGTHASIPTGSGVVNLVTVGINNYQYSSIVTYVAPATLNFNNISTTMRTQ
ncbi:MAG: pilus assembly protein [Rhizobacter sp.]|nr:pilus assembly protein [Rhizobacter sp.]